MPKRNDGNEQDLRVRPEGHSLDGDNPFTGERPEGSGPCDDHGNQVDLPAAETPDGTLSYNWLDCADVVPDGFSPLTTDKLFMRLMKNHFSDSDHICDPILQNYTYSDDPQESAIRIVMNTTFDTNQEGKLPAIIIKRGRQKMQRISIDDLGANRTMLQSDVNHSRFMQGSHRLLITGQSDGFTESLAFEVFRFLNAVSPQLRAYLPLHEFQVTDMSELGVFDDLGQTLGVAIEVVYAYEYSWIVRRPGPTLSAARVQPEIQLVQTTTEQANATLRNC